MKKRRSRAPTTRGAMAAAVLVLATVAGTPASAPAQTEEHPVASRARVDERPGSPLPLETTLTDEEGRRVRLGRFFRDGRPVLLVPGYYECRMLCSVVLDGLSRGLEGLGSWSAGEDFVVVGVSIDPDEGPAEARERRKQVGVGSGWHLLTGSEEAVARITDAVGFRYGYDPETDQYAHAAAVVAAAPDGRVSRYVYGVSPAPDTLDAVLAAARDGRAAGSLEQVLVRCFRFSPVLQRYAGALAWFLRAGGLVVLAGLAGVFVLAGRRAMREEAT